MVTTCKIKSTKNQTQSTDAKDAKVKIREERKGGNFMFHRSKLASMLWIVINWTTINHCHCERSVAVLPFDMLFNHSFTNKYTTPSSEKFDDNQTVTFLTLCGPLRFLPFFCSSFAQTTKTLPSAPSQQKKPTFAYRCAEFRRGNSLCFKAKTIKAQNIHL